MTIIVRTALVPVILIPISLFRAKILSVTVAIDRPKERASLSIMFICLLLKNTIVQAKPGRKNTSMKPKVALMAGTLSRKGRAEPMISLNPDRKPITYSLPLIRGLDKNEFGQYP